MSKKIPCGGFELGDSLVVKDGKLDLAEGGGYKRRDAHALYICEEILYCG